MRVEIALFVVASVALFWRSAAWECTPHMIIAEIARQQLGSHDEKAVNDFVQFMSQNGPFPKIPDMVQAACWSDDVLASLPMTHAWHFLFHPYNPTSVPIDGQCPVQDENLATVATAMLEATYRKYAGNRWEIAYGVTNYLHLMGDLHHPLHNAELFSAQFPKGDQGGQLFNVKVNGTVTTLHAFWDSVCGLYAGDLHRPLDSKSMKYIQDKAADLLSRYNPSNADKQVWNNTIISQASYNLAVSSAYAGIKPNSELPPWYTASCIPVAELQLVLAGYRMGNELRYAFGLQ